MQVLRIVQCCGRLWYTQHMLHRGVIQKLQRVNLSHFRFFWVLNS